MSIHETASGQQAAGEWNELKGRVRQRWGEFTDDEFEETEGQIEKLIGLIQQKTGETRAQVEEFVRDAAAELSLRLDRLNSSITGYSTELSDGVRAGYQRTEAMVRRHPSSALAVAFGAGAVAGLALMLCVRLAARD